jgi:DUF1680 family protein
MDLAKLYRKTGDERCLSLAKFFLDCRGKGSEYSQDYAPVFEQREAVGHAVRANYLYSGMADVAALTGDTTYIAAIDAIWENVVSKKLHITGGGGARASGEAYGDNYELPNRCYNETCAAIAYMFWNHRMFLMTGEAKYMDVFERTLYNGFLSGVSLSGDRFFYPNPLEYDGKEVNNHGHAGRAPWFGCACCPPNVLRTMASLGGYAYAVKDDQLLVNIYAQSDARAEVNGSSIEVSQQTNYPWDGAVKLTITPAKAGEFALCLRLPEWVLGKPVPSDLYTYDDPTPGTWTVSVNGKPAQPELSDGYAKLRRDWKPGDVVELQLPMPVRQVTGNEKIAATRGLVSLERGPIVYTFEGLDNDGSVGDIILPPAAQVTPVVKAELLNGVTILDISGAQRVTRRPDGGTTESPCHAVAIPYASWNNRGLSPMSVWLGRDVEHARLSPLPTITSTAKVSASFVRSGMDLGRLNDQQMPRNATDGFAPQFDFWPHLGGSEWVAYTLQEPTLVRGVTVSWFDDTSKGGACKQPISWRLSYLDEAGAWTPVEDPSEFTVGKASPVNVKFKPITTKALRIDIDLADGFSAGLYEWELETDK